MYNSIDMVRITIESFYLMKEIPSQRYVLMKHQPLLLKQQVLIQSQGKNLLSIDPLINLMTFLITFGMTQMLTRLMTIVVEQATQEDLQKDNGYI